MCAEKRSVCISRNLLISYLIGYIRFEKLQLEQYQLVVNKVRN